MGADSAPTKKVDLSKYKLVPEEKEEAKQGEFFIGKNHVIRDVITEAIELLTKEDGCRTLVFKARGQAVSKAVAVSEVIKRRVVGLHQIIKVDGGVVKHTYELRENPTEETRVVQEKFITGLQVCLSLEELDKTAPGYQEPLTEDQVTDAKDFTAQPPKPKKKRAAKKPSGGRGNGGDSAPAPSRGGGRGGSGPARRGRGSGGRRSRGGGGGGGNGANSGRAR
eukprot:TRINITY_DN3592_c2_g1_i1.p1 TRINITY_DN3592_c2_g1~~TRINITY_DN3592_c2_g1_i1.p1  ORF type:complete len:241 (+),score=78.00 TRINITY_DN3592_c2_g1_i1:55-723(+)